jgi:hypothetical protein
MRALFMFMLWLGMADGAYADSDFLPPARRAELERGLNADGVSLLRRAVVAHDRTLERLVKDAAREPVVIALIAAFCGFYYGFPVAIGLGVAAYIAESWWQARVLERETAAAHRELMDGIAAVRADPRWQQPALLGVVAE